MQVLGCPKANACLQHPLLRTRPRLMPQSHRELQASPLTSVCPQSSPACFGLLLWLLQPAAVTKPLPALPPSAAALACLAPKTLAALATMKKLGTCAYPAPMSVRQQPCPPRLSPPPGGLAAVRPPARGNAGTF